MTVDLERLPTLDDLAPVLLTVLDEDEAMSAFQVLTQAGYRIVRAGLLDALTAAEQRIEELEARDVLAGLPPDLARVLRDPSIVVSQDAAVFEQIAKWANAPSDTASADGDAGEQLEL